MITSIYDKFRRITSNQLYFPEIDGIRFLAIILVILFHTHGYFYGKTLGLFSDDRTQYFWTNAFFENGDRGVELFFVLSGFILCLPFAHHYINNGKKVSLKKYYLRRLTRLEPPYILVMTALFIIHIALRIPTPVANPPLPGWTASWLASLVYLHNIIYHHSPLLTVVAWSLEIEIQFYLFAPILFKVLALHKNVRRSILLVMGIGLMVAQHYYRPSVGSIYAFGQYFITGILLADFYVCNTWAEFFNRKWMLIPAILTIIAIIFWPIKQGTGPKHLLLAGNFTFPFLIGIFYYMVMKNDYVKKIFSFKFVPIIGGMCYSIYLLHYPIISFLGRVTMKLKITDYFLPNLFLQITLLVVPILIISSIFYLYVERPFMSNKWMDKLMKNDKHKEETNTVT